MGFVSVAHQLSLMNVHAAVFHTTESSKKQNKTKKKQHKCCLHDYI